MEVFRYRTHIVLIIFPTSNQTNFSVYIDKQPMLTASNRGTAGRLARKFIDYFEDLRDVKRRIPLGLVRYSFYRN